MAQAQVHQPRKGTAMKLRAQLGNVVFTMLVAYLTAGSGGVVAVGTYSTLQACKDEIARLEAEDKAEIAANPSAPQVSVVRQCTRKG
jgi:hypothetical protein